MDATLSWDFGNHAALESIFEKYMPTWAPSARSHATRMLAGQDSALVHMVDIPELFGGELRGRATVDFADGKIVRRIDYCESTAFDSVQYGQLRTPADSSPTDLRDAQVETRADRR
jgi:hypothetical protein